MVQQLRVFQDNGVTQHGFQVGHGAVAVRGAIHRRIVHQDEVAVAGDAHVHLDEVNADSDGVAERGESVLRRADAAPMGDDGDLMIDCREAGWRGEGTNGGDDDEENEGAAGHG